MKPKTAPKPSKAVMIEAAVQATLATEKQIRDAYEDKLDAAHKAARADIAKLFSINPAFIRWIRFGNTYCNMSFSRKAFSKMPSAKKLASLERNQPPRNSSEDRLRARIKRNLTQEEAAKLLADPVIAKRLAQLAKR